MAKLTLKRADTGATLDIFPDEHSAARPEGSDAASGKGGTMSIDFINELNPVQREAVTGVDGPVLIVAGAGSGKTRVLTYRIAYLLAQGVSPWNILSLTFTNKAASEMKERIAKLVGYDHARPLWMGTFHSVFSRILRREAEKLGFTSSFSIYDNDDSVGLVRASMAEFGISPQDYSPKMIHHRISTAKNSIITPTEYRSRASNALEERVGLLYDSYEKKLRASNAMDFDDLLVRTIELFDRFPDVLRTWQEQFRYLMIDEYQDTNRAQYVVVDRLAALSRNLCVVGDDAQSIYKFRGADIRNILDFERDYPGHKTFRLEQNYRSTKTILAAADEVIRNNRNRIDKTLWTDNDEGEKVHVVTARDEREEGDEILRIIQRETRLGSSLNEMAVLYRTNSQSMSIEDALRRANVPYALVGGVAFYRRKEVKDSLAYFRLVVNPRDDESFSRAVNTPARGIGDTSMKRLRAYAESQGIPLIEAATSPEKIAGLTPRVGTAMTKFVEMIDRARANLETISMPETARMLLTESGLLASYKDEATPEAIARWDNVQRILSHMAEYHDNNPDTSLDEYLQEIALLSEADSYDSAAERVTLMTIHSAKGLEFDTVIVAGLEEGLFPVGNSAHDEDELEEERRLFYVAITRARKNLWLTNCERRYRFGELSYPIPSRFLNEISDGLLEFGSTTPRPQSMGSQQGQGNTHRSGQSPTRGASPRDFTLRREKARQAEEKPQEEFIDDYSQVPKELGVGSIVLHPTFGRGRVEVMVGSGAKTKLTVRFESVGRKQLMLQFANLRVE